MQMEYAPHGRAAAAQGTGEEDTCQANANAGWCWPLAACAGKHQLRSGLFGGDAKAAEIKRARQQFFIGCCP